MAITDQARVVKSSLTNRVLFHITLEIQEYKNLYSIMYIILYNDYVVPLYLLHSPPVRKCVIKSLLSMTSDILFN